MLHQLMGIDATFIRWKSSYQNKEAENKERVTVTDSYVIKL